MSANLEIEREKVQCNESNQEDDKFSCSLCDHQATTKNNLKLIFNINMKVSSMFVMSVSNHFPKSNI